MKANILLFLALCTTALSLAEKFVKIEGTSGDFADIVVDSKGRWYIIKDETLYTSLDKGKTLEKIELPSKETVHTGLGIDQFDNIYVQDNKLSVFIVALEKNEAFVFEKIKLAFGNEQLISRPFALGPNRVFLATKSWLMGLDNSALESEEFEIRPYSKTYISQFVRHKPLERFGDMMEETFLSAGASRHWIYVNSDGTASPIAQTVSYVKRMFAVNDRIYFIVNGEKKVSVVQYKRKRSLTTLTNPKKSYVTTIDGIDVSNINDDTDFVIYSPRNDYKTYIYGNVGNSGVLYELGEKLVKGKNMTEVVSTSKLDNVRILSGAIQGDRLYLGTSDGIYELTDIQPKQVV